MIILPVQGPVPGLPVLLRVLPVLPVLQVLPVLLRELQELRALQPWVLPALLLSCSLLLRLIKKPTKAR